MMREMTFARPTFVFSHFFSDIDDARQCIKKPGFFSLVMEVHHLVMEVQPLLGALLALSQVRLHNHGSVSKEGPHSEIGSR